MTLTIGQALRFSEQPGAALGVDALFVFSARASSFDSEGAYIDRRALMAWALPREASAPFASSLLALVSSGSSRPLDQPWGPLSSAPHAEVARRSLASPGWLLPPKAQRLIERLLPEAALGIELIRAAEWSCFVAEARLPFGSPALCPEMMEILFKELSPHVRALAQAPVAPVSPELDGSDSLRPASLRLDLAWEPLLSRACAALLRQASARGRSGRSKAL